MAVVRRVDGARVLGRQMLAEFIGTAFLVLAVVGSGIAAQRLSPGDVGLQLLENAVATAAALGPVSGAHLNPVVSWADRLVGGITTRAAMGYTLAQIVGGVLGAWLANAMFSLPVWHLATKERSGANLWLSEVIATFGLVLLIFGLVRSRRASVAPFAVGAYIAGAYFFTSSTSFANPAVTLARAFSDTFSGISWRSVPGFVVAQGVGALLGLACAVLLYPHIQDEAEQVVVPKENTE